jgi:hypothetical protein
LEGFKAMIKSRRLGIKLGQPRTHLASFGNKSGIISQAVANSIERITRRRIELGFADEVVRNRKGLTHNAAYVTRPVVPVAFSTGRST